MPSLVLGSALLRLIRGLFRKMVEEGKVDPKQLAEQCPGKAITWDEEKKMLIIDWSKCVKSMNCIRRAFPRSSQVKIEK